MIDLKQCQCMKCKGLKHCLCEVCEKNSDCICKNSCAEVEQERIKERKCKTKDG